MAEIGPRHRYTAADRVRVKVPCAKTLGSSSGVGMGVQPHVLEIALDRFRRPVGTGQQCEARVAA